MLRKDFAPLGADHNEGGKINWAELFPLKVFSFTLNNYMWQLRGINGTVRPNFTSNLVHILAFGISKFYTEPY